MKSKLSIILSVLLLIIIGGYFGANYYVQKRAKVSIDNFIKENHLENEIKYTDVKSSLFSGSIRVDNITYYINDPIKKQKIGRITAKYAIAKGDLKNNTSVKLYGMSFINLNEKLSKKLFNKVVFTVQNAYYKVSKQGNIETYESSADNIKINTDMIFFQNELKKKKYEEFSKVVLMNNPIDVYSHYTYDRSKQELKIDNSRMDFKNNFNFSYSALIDGINIPSINKHLQAMKKNNDMMEMIAVAGELMSMKIKHMKFVFINKGIVERSLNLAAGTKNENKDIVINRMLKNSKNLYNGELYSSLKNLLSSKSKKFTFDIVSKNAVTMGQFMLSSRKRPLREIIDKQFNLSFSN